MHQPEVVIEAVRQRVVFRTVIGPDPEVPFSDEGRGVAGGLEGFGEGDFLLRQTTRGDRAQDAVLVVRHAGTDRVAAG